MQRLSGIYAKVSRLGTRFSSILKFSLSAVEMFSLLSEKLRSMYSFICSSVNPSISILRVMQLSSKLPVADGLVVTTMIASGKSVPEIRSEKTELDLRLSSNSSQPSSQKVNPAPWHAIILSTTSNAGLPSCKLIISLRSLDFAILGSRSLRRMK